MNEPMNQRLVFGVRILPKVHRAPSRTANLTARQPKSSGLFLRGPLASVL